MTRSKFSLIKEKYGKNEMLVFECISTYFTEIFYYHLYNEAVKWEADKSYPQISSRTEGYKEALKAWYGSIKGKKVYKACIKGIVKKIRLQLGGLSTFSSVLTLMTNQFVPFQWTDNIIDARQDKVLKKMFKICIERIIAEVAANLIPSVIDKRSKKNAEKTIKSINKIFLGIVIDTKERMLSESELLEHSARAPEIDAVTFMRFKKEYCQLVNENKKWKTYIVKLQEIIQKNNAERLLLEEKISTMELERESATAKNEF